MNASCLCIQNGRYAIWRNRHEANGASFQYAPWMAHYDDFTEYTYRRGAFYVPGTVNIGWLGASCNYEKIQADEALLDAVQSEPHPALAPQTGEIPNARDVGAKPRR